jgi:hypothetical protein
VDWVQNVVVAMWSDLHRKLKLKDLFTNMTFICNRIAQGLED